MFEGASEIAQWVKVFAPKSEDDLSLIRWTCVIEGENWLQQAASCPLTLTYTTEHMHTLTNTHTQNKM